MSTTIAGSLRVQFASTWTNTLDLSAPVDTVSQIVNQAFTNGTAADQAQVVWHDERTLTTGANEDLDLAGVLSSAFGVVTFTNVKYLVVQVTTTTTGYTLELGGKGSNAWVGALKDTSDILTLQAGSVLALSAPVDGYTVTAGTGDLLKVNNPSAGSVTYRIWIVGEGSKA